MHARHGKRLMAALTLSMTLWALMIWTSIATYTASIGG